MIGGMLLGLAIAAIIFGFVSLPLPWAIVLALVLAILGLLAGFAAFADGLFRGF